MKQLWVLCLSLGLLASVAMAAAPGPREVADEDVDFVIGQIKRYLYDSQQPDGHWTAWHSQGPGGGTTALALFALLDAGESPQDPRIEKGLKALIATKVPDPRNPGNKALYFVTFRIMALAQAVNYAEKSPYLEPLKADVDWLLRNNGAALGAWGYSGPEADGDNSCCQLALLALWEAQRNGLRVDPTVFRSAERTWLRRQGGEKSIKKKREDDGWSYSAIKDIEDNATASMTAAGLASLYICQDMLSNKSGPHIYQPQMDKATTFLAKLLKPDYINNEYLAFCVQRVGMASGHKFIGDMDWYAAGAAVIAQPNVGGKSFGGNWASIVRASFELLFLSRGRIPITFNKLQYGDSGDWNYHPRDLSHFTTFMRRDFERRMRWQIVRAVDETREMLDAPILLITGKDALNFTPQEQTKLREYTLRGGLLLLVPVEGSQPFLDSARQLLAGLYDEQRKEAGGHYELESIPPDHPFYDALPKIPNADKAVPLEGLSDGTRLLAIVCGKDLPKVWQQGIPPRKGAQSLEYAFGAKLFLYATGANDLSTRLRPVFISKSDAPTKHTARVGWLKHDGNWNTQPYALSYVGEKLVAENKVAVEAGAVSANYEQIKNKNLVWITGSRKMTLQNSEIQALRQYVDDGGMVFINAVGGAKEFDGSARELLRQIVPDATRGPAGATSPLMSGKIDEEVDDRSPSSASATAPATGKPAAARKPLSFRGPPVTAPKRTLSLRKFQTQSADLPLEIYVRRGMIVAVYARYGVHDTLDGHTAHGALSYMPGTARDLAANIVLYSLLPKPRVQSAVAETKPAAETQPAASQPASAGS